MVDVSGSGIMLKPGMVPLTENLATGSYKILIKALNPENGYDDQGKARPGEYVMAECIYPGNFIKEHQVKTVQDLLPKVINQIRARYGFVEANVTAIPKSLKAGEVIELEVNNGVSTSV